jgi:hypothetical protein
MDASIITPVATAPKLIVRVGGFRRPALVQNLVDTVQACKGRYTRDDVSRVFCERHDLEEGQMEDLWNAGYLVEHFSEENDRDAAWNEISAAIQRYAMVEMRGPAYLGEKNPLGSGWFTSGYRFALRNKPISMKDQEEKLNLIKKKVHEMLESEKGPPAFNSGGFMSDGAGMYEGGPSSMLGNTLSGFTQKEGGGTGVGQHSLSSMLRNTLSGFPQNGGGGTRGGQHALSSMLGNTLSGFPQNGGGGTRGGQHALSSRLGNALSGLPQNEGGGTRGGQYALSSRLGNALSGFHQNEGGGTGGGQLGNALSGFHKNEGGGTGGGLFDGPQSRQIQNGNRASWAEFN